MGNLQRIDPLRARNDFAEARGNGCLVIGSGKHEERAALQQGFSHGERHVVAELEINRGVIKMEGSLDDI